MLIIDNMNNTISETFIYGEFDNDYLYTYSNMEVAGSITASNGYYKSDARFTKNIHPYQNALDKISQLNGVTYEWNKEGIKGKIFEEGEQIGLIAQEVKEVMPELVREDRQGDLGINYSKLTTVLIEAMKEQQKMIEDLQKEVQDLKAAIQ